jgi:hypothetical protein
VEVEQMVGHLLAEIRTNREEIKANKKKKNGRQPKGNEGWPGTPERRN